VAELERLRCGGVDPLQDLNVAAAAAMLEAAAGGGACWRCISQRLFFNYL
jgi:hypothetical protein